MAEEIYASKIIVADDSEDGPVCVIEPGSIRFDGPGHGWVILGFDKTDRAAGMRLVSTDGKCTTTLRGAADATGLFIKRGDKETAIGADALSVTDQQRVVISDAGIAVNDGGPVLELPFLQSAFVREITESVVSQVMERLAEKLPAAST